MYIHVCTYMYVHFMYVHGMYMVRTSSGMNVYAHRSDVYVHVYTFMYTFLGPVASYSFSGKYLLRV
jgi:hypothetical protein